MSLLADSLGYARLAEPVRFRHAWEQQASLRIRNGRIIGGNREEIMDAAAAAYVALSADGTDTLLMAADHALRRELNRRIREDLITLGVVSSGPAVTIADATRASPGDLLRIEAITQTACSCAAPWTPTRAPGSAAGPTDTSCSTATKIPSSGTRSPTPTSPTCSPGRSSLPTRLQARSRLRTGPVRQDSFRDRPSRTGTEPPRRAGAGVLAAVLDHDGQQFSAAQTRHQALADADHLAILHAIWAAETNPARESSALS